MNYNFKPQSHAKKGQGLLEYLMILILVALAVYAIIKTVEHHMHKPVPKKVQPINNLETRPTK